MTKGYIKHTTAVPLGLLTTVLLSGLVLSSSIVSADNDSVVDEVNITVPVSCTMTGTGMDSHNAEINNGQYNSAIGETTMKAFCNDNNGFAIYAIGYTDNEDGKNVLTNSTLGSTYDIETGTAISGNDSQWAMKLSTVTSPTPTYPIIIAGSTDDTEKEQGDPDYSTFQEVPEDYTKVAYRTSATDTGTNAEGATLKSTYQAYISKTQPAGIYTGQVKYTLVHPYNTDKPTTPISIEDITYMQELAGLSADQIASLKNSMTEDAQYQMTDSRDNKAYYVAKLKDGNIWMTQNLDLDLESTPINVAPLTYENTDLPANTSWTPPKSTYATNDFTWINSETTPESYDPGILYSNSFVDGYENDNHYMIGNYYNWTAAVAMDDSSDYSYEHGYELASNQSICPAGWMLPLTREASKSFNALFNAYNYDGDPWNENGDAWTSPMFFTNNGYYGGEKPQSFYEVNLWTAVSQRSLNIGDEWTNGDNDGFYNNAGLGIRCLAR